MSGLYLWCCGGGCGEAIHTLDRPTPEDAEAEGWTVLGDKAYCPECGIPYTDWTEALLTREVL